MNWQRAGGGVGLVLLLGACEVEVQRPPPRPPPRYYYYATRPPPPPPGQVVFVQEEPPPQVRAPAPPPPQPVSARFPTRIVHPLPLADPGAQFLDLQGLQALVLRVRPNRKCGPR